MYYEKNWDQLYPKLKIRNVRVNQLKMPQLRNNQENNKNSQLSIEPRSNNQFPMRINKQVNNLKNKKLSPFKLYYEPELINKRWQLPQLQIKTEDCVQKENTTINNQCQSFLQGVDFEYSPIVQSPRYYSETIPKELAVSAQKKQLNVNKRKQKLQLINKINKPNQIQFNQKNLIKFQKPKNKTKKSWSAITFKKHHDISQFDQDINSPESEQDLFNYVKTLYKK